MVALAGIMLAANAAGQRYTWISYFPRPAAAAVFPLMELVVFALYARGLPERAAFAVRHYAWFLLLAAAVSILTTGIQLTPFSPGDRALAAWDERLGFRVVDVLAWTSARPLLLGLMRASYPALNAELFVVPALTAWCGDRPRMRTFLYAAVYSYLAGGLFYYLFPTSGPASILESPYFSAEQRLTGWKFYAVHHREPVTTIWGGMVAFPSFHCVWAILLTYAAGSRKALFLTALALNALVILSTLLLGWHFLVDVLASAALAAASLWAARRTHELIGEP